MGALIFRRGIWKTAKPDKMEIAIKTSLIAYSLDLDKDGRLEGFAGSILLERFPLKTDWL